MSLVIGLIQFLGRLIFDWWGWVPLVLVLSYLIWQNTRKTRFVSHAQSVLLLIEVPRDNDKQELSAEQMFAALHGIFRSKTQILREGVLQEHISFEIVSFDNQIRFYVWTPAHLKTFVEGQIYAQYPRVNIHEVGDDYTKQDLAGRIIAGAELSLTNSDVLPIKTFKSFEVDPLAGITAVLAKPEQAREQIWIQILARPTDDSWHSRGESFMQRIREGRGGGSIKSVGGFARNLATALWKPPGGNPSGSGTSAPEISDIQKAHIQAVNEKIGKLGYEVTVRFVHISQENSVSRLGIQSLFGAFKQFNDTNNGFRVKRYIDQEDALTRYRARLFLKRGFVLNIEELASLYHLPHGNVETPSMVWATTKTAEPPANLPSISIVPPDQLSPIGMTNFRGGNAQFGIKRTDRERHLYIIGQTGTGKSFLMELLALSDIYHHHGFAIIDPHGDLATHVLRYIPENRVEDVVYFNPTDTSFPMAFNPLEVTDPAMKGHISSEIVGVLKRMFGYSWGPRLEYVLRYTLLALLDYPNATMLGITRMLTEKDYRKRIIKQIQDPVVKSFWTNEFASWNEKFATEAVAPILNKVGAFTANPLIRNILGQPKSAINIREIMDSGKILIVNLSHGQVGEDNAAILGALIVTKIQLAALSRANIEFEQRRPFYLYVDEFQNFATDSFATILSEARKYGLNLTIANQYVAQMAEEVRDAVFGNVGNTVTFRVGAEDAHYLSKYFEPSFEAQDLIRLHNRHFIISLSIDGEKAPPFSATTLELPQIQTDHRDHIVQFSRQRYGTSKEIVTEKIARWANYSEPEQKQNKATNRRSTPVSPKTTAKNAHNELQPDETIHLR